MIHLNTGLYNMQAQRRQFDYERGGEVRGSRGAWGAVIIIENNIIEK